MSAQTLIARRVARTLAGLTLYWLATPAGALACSVCIGASNEDTTIAYRAMTAFMTFTPMLIIGSVILFIWRRFKALDAQEAARASGLAPGSPGDLGR